jgi:tetratricopeptide (TPR) repeat protein
MDFTTRTGARFESLGGRWTVIGGVLWPRRIVNKAGMGYSFGALFIHLQEGTKMGRRELILSFAFLTISLLIRAQGLPPLGQGAEQKPAAATTAPSGQLPIETANADLKTARAANQEKRYADAETLMTRDTALRAGMPYLWIELGKAQLGLKKYAEAEASFKAALGGGEPGQKQPISGAFYSEGKGTVGHISVQRVAATPEGKTRAEIEGISYSSLGQLYILSNKVPEAKAAFDEAAKDFPEQAPLYYRNETVFFLQAGNAPEQVAAAEKAIAVDPTRAVLYFYKGQGLAAQATVDAKTQKLTLPAGCADALQKYLDLDPSGSYSTDVKGMLAAAGIAVKTGKK